MITAFIPLRARGNRLATSGEPTPERPGVAEVYSVSGAYARVVVLRLRNLEELNDAVTQGILALEGVERAERLLAFRAYPRKLLDQGFAQAKGKTGWRAP